MAETDRAAHFVSQAKLRASKIQEEHKTSLDRQTFRSKDLNIGVRNYRQPLSNTAYAAARTTPAEHFDLETQREAFEFVQSDVEVEKALDGPHAWIELLGVRGRKFYHYQIYGAFWLLKEERGFRRGAIEADLMGLGKTTITWLYVLFNFCLAEMDVDRKKHPERHCPGRAGALTACPSQHRWPVVCSCVPGGLAQRLGLTGRPGATLILVPFGLLRTWQREWEALEVDTKLLPLSLFIHHGDSLSVPPIRQHHLKLTAGTDGRLSILSSDTTHHYAIMTTVESYQSKVCKLFGNSQGVLKHASSRWDGLAWARVIRDEMHLTTKWNTQLFRILESFTRTEWVLPNLLALTATPMLRNGVEDMVNVVRIINMLSPDIARHPDCAAFASLQDLEKLKREDKTVRSRQIHYSRGKVLEEQGPERPRARKDKRDHEQEQRVGLMVGRLQSAYCIRRRNSTVQNGKSLALIPPIEYYDVDCNLPNHSANMLVQEVEWLLKEHLTRRWVREVGDRAAVKSGNAATEVPLDLFLDNAVATRILATLPHLASYKTKDVLTWQGISKRGWVKAPQESWLTRDIDRMVASSGKLQQLRELIGRLGNDVDGAPEKLVVVSEFPVVCLAVLVLLRRMSIAGEWMHADLDAYARESLASNFQASRGDRESNFRCRVLVGSTNVLGQGITLNRANRLVLMEPLLHSSVEDQVAKRIHRIGSRTDRSWFYRLVNSASSVERLLVADQDEQRRYQILAGLCMPPVQTGSLANINWSMRSNEAAEIDDGQDVVDM